MAEENMNYEKIIVIPATSEKTICTFAITKIVFKSFFIAIKLPFEVVIAEAA
ncbi:MAG: hypothetical protein JKY81_06460 [Colwellia sp.]|nr:hypothetical protein [Colwellia sp.]